MKKLMILFLCASLLLLSGCEQEGQSDNTKNRGSENADFLIICPEGGIEEHTASLIHARLSKKDCSARILHMLPTARAIAAAKVLIYVETEPEYTKKPYVHISLEPEEKPGGSTLSPCLSSRSIARAAVLLLPDADHYSVISAEEGAADVQDACDILDMSGVDYTVETLDGRSLADTATDAAKKGCDVLILPSEELSEGELDLSSFNTAIFAVGKGEHVGGALASFCIDTEALAACAADLAMEKAEGAEGTAKNEDFYILCINETIAASHKVDIEAVSEDFSIAFVQ